MNLDSHQASPTEEEAMDEPLGAVTRSQAHKLLHDLHKGLTTLETHSPYAWEAMTMLSRQEEVSQPAGTDPFSADVDRA